MPVGYRFYWDDHCRLCNSLKRLAVALDWSNRVTFLSLLSESADLDLGHLSFEERMRSSHLVGPDHRVYSAGAGIVELASLMPLLSPLVLLFRWLPGHQALTERLYRLVASHRGVPYGGSCKVSFDPPEEAT